MKIYNAVLHGKEFKAVLFCRQVFESHSCLIDQKKNVPFSKFEEYKRQNDFKNTLVFID